MLRLSGEVYVQVIDHALSGLPHEACGLLVAADPLSQSGKARTARKYGIPVIGADEFTALANRPR